MINLLRRIVVFFLSIPVRILLFRLKPEVIAITGSAGKTSAKEFLRILLSEEYDVLVPEEGYNTEIGAPLAVFNEKAPLKLFSPFSWLFILFKMYFKAIFQKDLAEKVIVEMGADKPGDIKYLVKMFKPSKAIILSILPTHLAEFKSVENIAAEKAQLAFGLGEKGTLFLNFDDPKVREMAKNTKAKVVYFGTQGDIDFKAKGIETSLQGLSFTLKTKEKEKKINVRISGKQMIFPLLSAIAVAESENIPEGRQSKAFSKMRPFKGRMNVLEGLRESIIIDDSYNANPESMIAALEFLESEKGRKIALLGNMNELGSFEKEGHEMVGRKAAKVADILVTVGDVAEKYLASTAKQEGLKNVRSFTTSLEAGQYLRKIIKSDDIILAKGSQNKVRMEKAVAEIISNPNEASKVLVRQGPRWK